MSEWFKEHDWKSCDWENWSGGSNPLLCAKQKNTPSGVFFCYVLPSFEEDSRVGAVLREQNALPYENRITKNLLAKDDVDNVGAGRAAKGANPLLCAKQKNTPSGVFFCPYFLLCTYNF